MRKPTYAELADAAAWLGVYADREVFRGAWAVGGPTRALAALYTAYRAAWPTHAADALRRDWDRLGARYGA